MQERKSEDREERCGDDGNQQGHGDAPSVFQRKNLESVQWSCRNGGTRLIEHRRRIVV
jgi:hypothetical protein